MDKTELLLNTNDCMSLKFEELKIELSIELYLYKYFIINNLIWSNNKGENKIIVIVIT